MFSVISGRHYCVPDWDIVMAFPCQSSINLCETFIRITWGRSIAQTWDSAKLISYQPPIIPRILDCFNSIVLNLFFRCVTVKTSNNYPKYENPLSQTLKICRFLHASFYCLIIELLFTFMFFDPTQAYLNQALRREKNIFMLQGPPSPNMLCDRLLLLINV